MYQLALEKYQHQHTYRYSSVCDIEHRFKKYKILSTYKRKTLGHSHIDDGEVEHIDHPPVKQLAIALPEWYHCRTVERAFRKNEAVEDTVYQVAQSSCQYQRTANDGTFAIAFIYNTLEEIEP